MLTRLFPHPGLSAMLALVWLLLVNQLTVGGLLVAVAVGVVVPLVTAPFWPQRPALRFGWRMAEYLAVMIVDIVLANLQIARVILFRRNRDLRSHWLVVPLDLRSPEAITALAATISLTPGTVSADIAADGRTLLVHALDTADPEGTVARIKRRYESRLMRIFA